MKISKFQFGNKVPKPSEDFIKQKLGYGATSTIGTQSQKTQQNQAAQQSQSRADTIKYLKALKEGQNWAINKSVQNMAMNPGSIKALPKDYKIEDGHIPTQEEINKENELRQNPIKGISLRNKEDWENNRSPIKAILKSGVLYANPYTGALNAGYNLANPETGVSATYNNFKNGNYLQCAVSGAFNLLDAGIMGNGITKTAQKLISKRPLKSIGQYSQTPLKYSFDTSVKSFEFPEYKTATSSDLSDGNPIIFNQPYKLNEAVDNLPKRYRTNSNEIINPQDKEFAEIREFENIEPIPATKTIRYKDLEQVNNATRSLGIKNPEIKGIVNWNNDPDISGILLERINADGLKNGFKNILNTQLDNFNTNYPETPILTDYVKDVINNKITTAPNPWLYFSDELSKTGGYFNPNNNQTFINLRQIGPNPEAIGRTVVHENISHFTDNLLPEVIKGKYKSLLNKLNIKDKDSNDWKELRATLNELKFNLSKKGNFNEMKENLYLMDNDELAESLENINSYGSEYAKQLRSNPQLMNSLRKAILTLPATLPFINKGNSK